ncbi:MAG: vanadium-dependent haloperoxidase [Chitinophagaceae bacterium]
MFLFLTKQVNAQPRDIAIAERSVKCLTDVMVHDITSPLVASRDYAYSLIAFYEAVRPGKSSLKSYAGQLNGLKALPEIIPGSQYDWLIAGTTAFYKTSYALVFSKDQFQIAWDEIVADLKKRRISPLVFERSVKFGDQVAEHILNWAKKDNYIHTRTLQRYTPFREAGFWKQTPPDYMEAIEPYWNQIRPMVLSRPDEFLLPKPAPYNSEQFLAGCKEVFETSQKNTPEQTAEANFWDCNPFATQTIGHMVYSVKKISPGAHWIGITGIAIKKQKQPLQDALLSYSLVSVAIFDAFIACWDEKYRSNYIRPVTAIQILMAPTWQPILQTPPFPEYPSGHSVISTASAVILTRLYGDNFHYIDYVEKQFGIADRVFNSFNDAANEAAMSRLYGGIHFRQAIENGKDLGRMVGEKVLEKFKP